jgi:hypothetical protein
VRQDLRPIVSFNCVLVSRIFLVRLPGRAASIEANPKVVLAFAKLVSDSGTHCSVGNCAAAVRVTCPHEWYQLLC